MWTLMSLSGMLQMMGSSLTVKLDFGDGFVASTTVTSEPVRQAVGSNSGTTSNPTAHTHVGHACGNLLENIQVKFAELVRSKCKRVATIVIQTWIGEHSVTATHRFTPSFMPHPFLDIEDGLDDDLDDGNDRPRPREVANIPKPSLRRLPRRNFDDLCRDGGDGHGPAASGNHDAAHGDHEVGAAGAMEFDYDDEDDDDSIPSLRFSPDSEH